MTLHGEGGRKGVERACTHLVRARESCRAVQRVGGARHGPVEHGRERALPPGAVGFEVRGDMPRTECGDRPARGHHADHQQHGGQQPAGEDHHRTGQDAGAREPRRRQRRPGDHRGECRQQARQSAQATQRTRGLVEGLFERCVAHPELIERLSLLQCYP